MIVTDAPLLRSELRQTARRAGLGVGRVGGFGEESSGDIFLAVGTGLDPDADSGPSHRLEPVLSNLDQLYEATVQATEEAIVNALVAAKTMTGMDGNHVHRLPHNQLRSVLRKYGRLNEPTPADAKELHTPTLPGGHL